MDKVIEITCASPEEVIGEISLRVQDFEFVSVVKKPTAFLLLRMQLKPPHLG